MPSTSHHQVRTSKNNEMDTDKDDRDGIGVARLGMIEKSVGKDSSIGGCDIAHDGLLSACCGKRATVDRDC